MRVQNFDIRAEHLAAIMFGASCVFVVLVATLIVLWVDIPRVAELSVLEELAHDSAALADLERNPNALAQLVQDKALVKLTDPFGKLVQQILLFVWPVFWLEYFYALRGGGRKAALSRGGCIRLLACAIPPLRLAAPVAAFNGQIWLPRLGWQMPGKALSRQLQHAFSKPMLCIALLILPVLLIQYGLHTMVEREALLRVVLHASTGFIWCAFTIEFIIMVSVTDKRLAYIKTHWIDLAIILLPLVSFLRSIRVLNLARVAKVQKLAKMGRVFRVRGLAMKSVRALMLIGVVNRLLRITPEKQLAKLRKEHEDRLEELAELEERIQLLEAQTDLPLSASGRV